MKMLARLRYLIDEGFEVLSICGYDDETGKNNARLMFVENHGGSRRVHSEIFDVQTEEMERCADLFLEHHSRRE